MTRQAWWNLCAPPKGSCCRFGLGDLWSKSRFASEILGNEIFQVVALFFHTSKTESLKNQIQYHGSSSSGYKLCKLSPVETPNCRVRLCVLLLSWDAEMGPRRGKSSPETNQNKWGIYRSTRNIWRSSTFIFFGCWNQFNAFIKTNQTVSLCPQTIKGWICRSHLRALYTWSSWKTGLTKQEAQTIFWKQDETVLPTGAIPCTLAHSEAVAVGPERFEMFLGATPSLVH